MDSSRIFNAVLHLYGTRGYTKIWAKIISAPATKCSRFPSLRGGGWDQKRGGSVATYRGMNAKQGDYKCGDRINTLPNTHESLEKKRVNLCIARGPFGAIISMKIVIYVLDSASQPMNNWGEDSNTGTYNITRETLLIFRLMSLRNSTRGARNVSFF